MNYQRLVERLEQITSQKVTLKETIASQLLTIHKTDKDPKWKEVIDLQKTWDIVKEGLSNSAYDKQWEELLNSGITATDLLPKLMKIWSSIPDEIIVTSLIDTIRATYKDLNKDEIIKLNALNKETANNILINKFIDFYNDLRIRRAIATNPFKVPIDKLIGEISEIEDQYRFTKTASNAFQRIIDRYTSKETKQLNYTQPFLDALKDFVKEYGILNIIHKTQEKKKKEYEKTIDTAEKTHKDKAKELQKNIKTTSLPGLNILKYDEPTLKLIKHYSSKLEEIVNKPISFAKVANQAGLTADQERLARPIIQQLERLTQLKPNF